MFLIFGRSSSLGTGGRGWGGRRAAGTELEVGGMPLSTSSNTPFLAVSFGDRDCNSSKRSSSVWSGKRGAYSKGVNTLSVHKRLHCS